MAEHKRKSRTLLGVKITKNDLSEDDWGVIHRFAVALEKGRFNEYVEVLQNTKKLFWKSFVAGVGKGLGAILGATVVLALLVALLALIGGVLPGNDPIEQTGKKIDEVTTK